MGRRIALAQLLSGLAARHQKFKATVEILGGTLEIDVRLVAPAE